MHFEHFFPRMKRHAKFIDECHSSRRSLCFSIVKKEKIVFCDPDNNNLIKACFLTIIASISEVQCEVEKLWQRGVDDLVKTILKNSCLLSFTLLVIIGSSVLTNRTNHGIYYFLV